MPSRQRLGCGPTMLGSCPVHCVPGPVHRVRGTAALPHRRVSAPPQAAHSRTCRPRGENREDEVQGVNASLIPNSSHRRNMFAYCLQNPLIPGSVVRPPTLLVADSPPAVCIEAGCIKCT